MKKQKKLLRLVKIKETHAFLNFQSVIEKLGYDDKVRMYICPKCNKIMNVTELLLDNRRDYHHNHLTRCKPGFFIARWADALCLSGYDNQDMPFYFWKLL